MTIVDFTPISALVGGLMIGTASAAALALNGKIPGISGWFGRIFRGVPGDTAEAARAVMVCAASRAARRARSSPP